MNRRQRRGVSLATLLATFAGVSLLLLTMVLGAGAQGTTTMNAQGGTISGVGLTTTTNVVVTIDAADGGTMDAYQIKIGFDKTKVNVQSVGFPGLWNAFPAPSPVIDNANGNVLVKGLFLVNNPGDPTCTSPCTAFSITWVGMAAGTSPLTDLSTGIVLSNAGIQMTYNFTGGTVTVNGPTATNTPVTPATNTPVTPATNTPVTPATNTPVTPATNTPVTPGTSTPVTPGTATNTPVTPATNTPVTPVGTGTTTPQATASGSNTPVPTSTPVTSTPTPTPIPGGPRTYKLYLPEVADDGIPGSGQLVRALSEGVVARVLGPLLGN